MRIDVRGEKDMQTLIAALKNSETDVRRAIRTYAKAELTTPWLSAINKRASSAVETRVLAATATVAVSDQNIRITSAAKGRSLSGGLRPKLDYGPVEFGMQPRRSAYTRKGHKVTRRVGTQFKAPNRKGYVFYPAAREMIPRLASLWVQSVVKVYGDIFEGRR